MGGDSEDERLTRVRELIHGDELDSLRARIDALEDRFQAIERELALLRSEPSTIRRLGALVRNVATRVTGGEND